jgi:hypothetical protein
LPAYDHADARAAVYAHLCEVPGLTAFELSRVLGWDGRRGFRYTTTRRASTALRELEDAGRVRSELAPAENGRHRRIWFPCDMVPP